MDSVSADIERGCDQLAEQPPCEPKTWVKEEKKEGVGEAFSWRTTRVARNRVCVCVCVCGFASGIPFVDGVWKAAFSVDCTLPPSAATQVW